MGRWPGHKLSGSFRNLGMGECSLLARPVAPGMGQPGEATYSASCDGAGCHYHQAGP